MLKQFAQTLRDRTLARHNRSAIRRSMDGRIGDDATPVFFIFTSDLVHFAPYCIPIDVPNITPIIVLNGVSEEDAQWIRQIHDGAPVISLRASLSNNSQSLLSHATVINDLFAVVERPFCIQDPDCFVTDNRFYGSVSLDATQHYAAGPFTKKPTDHDHILPDTFFVLFNNDVFKSIQREFGVSADVTRELPSAAQQRLREICYRPGQYPEQFKEYFDTLQAFWLLSMTQGRTFNKLAGENETIYHIGGTSYLKNSAYDLTHWDYWPLSVRYFNLCLIERSSDSRFRDRFAYLFDLHGSPDAILRDYPDFVESKRFGHIHSILTSIESMVVPTVRAC